MKEIIVCFWVLHLTQIFISLSLCEDNFNITKKSGESIDLNCTVTGNKKVMALKLTRNDLRPEFVLVYRDDRIDEEHQNPLFKNRTKLQSPHSINGTVTLMLKNLTEKDNGTYICRVKCETGGTRRKRATSQTIFRLNVVPSSPQGNQPGMTENAGKNNDVNDDIISRTYVGSLIVGISVIVVVMTVALVFIAKNKNSHLPPPPEEETLPKLLVQCSSEREKISSKNVPVEI